MAEIICNLIPSAGGALYDADIADNLTTTDSGKVLDARQGKVLNDQISAIKQFSSIQRIVDKKGLFRYGFNCDRSTTTTLIINPRYTYNSMNCLIMTRYSLVAMYIGANEKGKAYSVNQISLMGTAPFTASVANDVVTLTMPAWEDFEMLFMAHSSGIPVFSIVNN